MAGIALNFIAKFPSEQVTWYVRLRWSLLAELGEHTLNLRSGQTSNVTTQEVFSEYVAHLQLHMALQSRNLVPALTKVGDSREQLLQQTQADFEKLISRQSI